MNKISIIIPTFNEAGFIKPLLYYLKEKSNPNNIAEIIIVDGGSKDNTPNIVASLDINVKLISSEKGRAKQMNNGVKIATGDILYFLHADSYPPFAFDQLIINEIKKGNNAGCFRMQFKSKHWWLKLVGWFTKFNWRACRGGDQSQFITKVLFDEIDGYDENFIVYEDNILINKLYKKKEFTVINKKLITSARLYEKFGVWKVQYHFLVIYFKRWVGSSAKEILNYYKKHLT